MIGLRDGMIEPLSDAELRKPERAVPVEESKASQTIVPVLRIREVAARVSPAMAAQRSGRRQPRTRCMRPSMTPSVSESDR